MKTKFLTLALALGLLTSLGFAQSETKIDTAAALSHAKRHRDPKDAASNKALRAAAKDIREAIAKMQKALPIYDGLRVESIEESKNALKEIRQALKVDKTNANAAAVKKAADTVKPSDAKKKYGPGQIAESQARMQAAISELKEAKTLLDSAEHDYQGHRAAAAKCVQTAIDDATKGLALHAAPTP